MEIFAIFIVGLLLVPYHLKTKISINAPKDKVLKTLMDTPNYPQWNPFIENIKSTLILNKPIEITLNMGDKKMHFNPTITQMDKNGFSWRGSLGLRYIFDGEHRFFLEESANERTIFYHTERFQGLLVWIFYPTMKQTKRRFELMNRALLLQAEKRS